jgi:hypothetical protein
VQEVMVTVLSFKGELMNFKKKVTFRKKNTNLILKNSIQGFRI